MAKGQKNPNVLPRTIKFEIFPDPQQEESLRHISQVLADQVWNEAVSELLDEYEIYRKPIYDEISAVKQVLIDVGLPNIFDPDLWAKKKFGPELADQYLHLRDALLGRLKRSFEEHSSSLFDHINSLTARRANDKNFAAVLRNWQEETLDTVHAGFKSFWRLRKQGDPDARPPGIRELSGFFYEIPGRTGFSVQRDTLILRFSKLGCHPLAAAIPAYQKGKLQEWLASWDGEKNQINDIVKKFTLYRSPKDLTKPGRYWISLACDVKKPAVKPTNPSAIIFIAPGTVDLALLAPEGECFRLLKLARPDFHWLPKITAVEERMEREKKGSKTHRRLAAARRNMFRLLRAQNKLRNRTLANRLMAFGIHFVVAEVPIRSKPGKLADAAKPERGGKLGLNWAVQNTGTMADLFDWLEEKVKEYGGWVERFKPTSPLPDREEPDYKKSLVQNLRLDWLTAQNEERKKEKK